MGFCIKHQASFSFQELAALSLGFHTLTKMSLGLNSFFVMPGLSDLWTGSSSAQALSIFSPLNILGSMCADSAVYGFPASGPRGRFPSASWRLWMSRPCSVGINPRPGRSGPLLRGRSGSGEHQTRVLSCAGPGAECCWLTPGGAALRPAGAQVEREGRLPWWLVCPAPAGRLAAHAAPGRAQRPPGCPPPPRSLEPGRPSAELCACPPSLWQPGPLRFSPRGSGRAQRCM